MMAAWKEHRWGRPATIGDGPVPGRLARLQQSDRDYPLVVFGRVSHLSTKRVITYGKGALLWICASGLGEPLVLVGAEELQSPKRRPGGDSQDFQASFKKRRAEISPIFNSWVYERSRRSRNAPRRRRPPGKRPALACPSRIAREMWEVLNDSNQTTHVGRADLDSQTAVGMCLG